MKANINTKKKSSTRKKLIPAAGSLLISAAMLSTSTYAWFTMSREVEVTGIKMTATVPEDLQISLGRLADVDTPNSAEVDENGVSLGASTGVLYSASAGAADNGGASAPEKSWDWSNSADISAYYQFGRLIPASSYDGREIFFTPDANGVGKTVKGNASYYQATDKLTPVADAGTGTTYKTTLHAKTSTADNWNVVGTGAYAQADTWNKTKDDGYYVDIPIWLRTSSNEAINLSVDGYVLPGSLNTGEGASNKETDLELYRAIRVAILDGETVSENASTGAVACTAGDAAVANTNNIIPLKDAWDTSANVTDGTFSAITGVANPWANTLTSVVDSANLATTGRTLPSALTAANQPKYAKGAEGQMYAGVSAAATTATDPDGDGVVDTYAGTYTDYTCITPTSAASAWSNVATVAGSTTNGQYGAAKKLIIRVWLDGEDFECWNDNAGQDWAIALKFAKIES